MLKDKEAERYLPIWIGLYEFEAITVALQKIEVARPLTHDLMLTILNVLDIKLICIEVTALESDTFYANLVVEQDGVRKYIDCRPSDAIALVVRTGVPIYVDEDVLDRAAIQSEENAAMESSESTENEAVGSDLSIFENFLGQLGNDNPDLTGNEPQEDDPNKVD